MWSICAIFKSEVMAYFKSILKSFLYILKYKFEKKFLEL